MEIRLARHVVMARMLSIVFIITANSAIVSIRCMNPLDAEIFTDCNRVVLYVTYGRAISLKLVQTLTVAEHKNDRGGIGELAKMMGQYE